MRFTWREQHDDIADAIISDATATVPEGESLTEQRHAQDADLNVIVKRFGITDGSTIPNINMDPRTFAETDDRLDLRTIIDTARNAQRMFEQLPADIRRRFDHDPATMWQYINDDPEGAVAMGLLKKTAAEIPTTETTPKDTPPAPKETPNK